MVNINLRNQSIKVYDALWEYRMAYKTPIWISPYRLCLVKVVIFRLRLKQSYWAINNLNFGLKASCERRKLKLNKLEEFRNKSYKSARIFKDHAKSWHDKNILRYEFHLCLQILLFYSRLTLLLGNLKSRWKVTYKINQVFLFDTIEL